MLNLLNKDEFKDTKDYLINERKLSIETLIKYKVGADKAVFIDENGNRK